MGVTYYKLEQRYEGDKTKGCGLTSAEVDANFHFLRGYDIKDATLSPEGVLTLTRVNCDEIVVSGLAEYIKSVAQNTMDGYDEPFKLDGTKYNPENGVLTIFVNGNPYTVEGFEDTHFDFKLFVGDGLDGKGTIADPVRVSHINDTGFFAPVEKVIDYEQGEKLPVPEEGGDVEKRYITREAKSPFGLLYTYDAVQAINAYLEEEGHGWHVPTFDEWNAMLNAQEDCDSDDTNHGNRNESSQNGRVAGQKLKDILWNEETAGEGRFNILPIEIETFNTRTEVDLKTASFWAIDTSSADTHVYGKKFIEKRGTVATLGSGHLESDKLSLRLVRDSSYGNTSGVEEIGGVPYKTVLMPTYKVDSLGRPILGTAVWTEENVTFSEYLSNGTNEELAGEAAYPFGPSMYLPDESAYTETMKWNYYLNQYDSFDKKWVKRELQLNDIVMVHEFGNESDVELILKLDNNGEPELRLRQNELYSGISQHVAALVEEERQERQEADRELWEAAGTIAEELSAETIERIAADEALQDEIEDLDTRLSEVERASLDGIQEEADLRASGDTILQEQIDELDEALAEESQARVDNDIKYGNYTANLGCVEHGLTIKSNDGEKRLNLSFNMDMGEFSIE